MAYTKTMEKTVYNFVVSNKELISSVELMGVSDPDGFNDMKGYHAEIRLKVVPIIRYRHKNLGMTTISTYLGKGV